MAELPPSGWISGSMGTTCFNDETDFKVGNSSIRFDGPGGIGTVEYAVEGGTAYKFEFWIKATNAGVLTPRVLLLQRDANKLPVSSSIISPTISGTAWNKYTVYSTTSAATKHMVLSLSAVTGLVGSAQVWFDGVGFEPVGKFFEGYLTADQALTPTVTALTGWTWVKSTGGIFNTATGIYTASKDGFVEIKIAGTFNPSASGELVKLLINKNGSVYNRIFQQTTANGDWLAESGAVRLYLNSGDAISFTVQCSSGNTVVCKGGSTSYTYLTINEVL